MLPWELLNGAELNREEASLRADGQQRSGSGLLPRVGDEAVKRATETPKLVLGGSGLFVP